LGACLIILSAGSARADERAMEALLLDEPTAAAAQTDSTRLNQESHYPGTPGDYHIAQWMRDELASAGFQASLEAFPHPVPFVKYAKLEMRGLKGRWSKLALDEVPIPQDPDGTRRDAGQPFNAWSGNGVAVGTLVDAGHGLASDYAALAAQHVDVHARILLIRYGREFRGALAKRAQDRGAKAVIFFSDPTDDDGSQHGPAYPEGPYRPLGSVQRGALIEGAIKIPTLPISALVAQQLLAATSNGIGNAPIRLTVKMQMDRKATLWNTLGVLPGTDPTHTVILGAHRDAWVYGVTDNGSGISVALATARALGYLYRSGWRPQFTIVIVGFDGEEIGEVGSNAYVRMHQDELEKGCIAYINEDEIATGQTFGASAAAALQNTILLATEAVPDPQTATQTIFERWRAQTGGTRVRGPGGGSDFEPFLYNLGIPILQVGFRGIFGVYHSGFDDLNYVQTQADPGFVDHRAVSQLVALMTMRLASGVTPYRLTPYAAQLRDDVATLTRTSQHGRDLAPLSAAIDRFARAASRADGRGLEGNAEIAIVRRLDKLTYGRDGYAAVPLPGLNGALLGDNEAAISAAVGSTIHDLDAITGTIASAPLR
jgi:N-acetylated-alpha-linked acidic dipeptidase